MVSARAATYVAVAAAIVPVLTALVRALASGWTPIGDNAYFTVRAGDVLTRHHPLLGAWSSGSAAVDSSVNNLGPLQLDLLAPFVKLGPAAGTAVSVVAINVASIVVIAYAANRLTGRRGAIVAMVGTASLTWAMGSALLVEPRQHHAMVLPFMCFLVLVWAVAADHSWALPGAVLSGSLVLQSHLSYALLVPALSLWALAWCAWWGLRAHRDPDAWPVWLARTRRHGLVALAIAIMSWIQPLIDQFFGQHNLSDVLGSSGQGDTPGLASAARMTASVLALPPWWFRPSFSQFHPELSLPGSAAAAAGLVALGVVLLAAGHLAARSGNRQGVVGTATAGFAVLVAIASAARMPVSSFGLGAGNYRWLWPIGALVLITVLVAGASAVGPRGAGAGVVLGALSAVAVLLGALNIPASYQAGDPENGSRRIAVSRQLNDQLDDLQVDDPVLVDREASYFGEPFTHAVLVELQSLGIDFRFDVDDEISRYGEGRRADGEETARMTFGFGADARTTPDGWRRVAFVTGLDAGEQREMNSLGRAITDELAHGDLVVDLDAAGDESGDTFETTEAAIDGSDVNDLFLAFELRRLRTLDLVQGQQALLASLDRWLQLVDRHDTDTVAVFLTPTE